MENLSHKEILTLNEVIGDLYSLRDLMTFHFQALQLLRKAVRVDSISYNEFDSSLKPLHTITGSAEHSDSYAKHGEGFRTYASQHPCWPSVSTDRVNKITDLLTADQFRSSSLYNEYYRHIETKHQIFVPLPPNRQNTFFFALSRKTPDFNEKDRTILTLLRPHIINALRNVSELYRLKTERDLLEKGIETERQGAVLLDSEGAILGITLLARELMKKYLDASPSEGDHIAGELLTWFQRETASPPSRIERPPFVVEKSSSCLKITLVRDATTRDCILLLYERDAASMLKGLERYGLTCREAEVLIWVGKGKTNQEIGIILNMSRRTVEKHMENIFMKLGVETRSAAAAMVIQH